MEQGIKTACDEVESVSRVTAAPFNRFQKRSWAYRQRGIGDRRHGCYEAASNGILASSWVSFWWYLWDYSNHECYLSFSADNWANSPPLSLLFKSSASFWSTNVENSFTLMTAALAHCIK